MLQQLGAAGDQEPVADTSAAVSTAAARLAANILQHSLRCPDKWDGDLSLIPRPKIVLVSISRLQQKYFICYVKLLPIIHKYFPSLIILQFERSVISIKDMYIRPNIQIYLQIQNPKKLFTFGKKYLQRVSGWLGVWVCSSSLVS